ncbi:hypothetical protein L598_000900001050 [Mesorhizobium sp. J18]|uniref:DUF167 family protein n=1 Tax=Mesorhizobium sp. J18 TaxID=935263 RepID=UPI00119AD5EC|nr:DUF167 family protein [Mesorhizobium sp. J18]TWG89026.1 hypothetical protein L598_000900001050 [Mesorhizobium sp. J18]
MKAKPPAYLRVEGDGVAVFIRLTPKSSKDALDGVGETGDGRLHLKARVRAIPEDGKANKALTSLLADRIGVPASSLSVVSGHTSRLKTVFVQGDPEQLLRMMADLASR